MARTDSLQGAVFAKDATTVIPPSPVVGTTYRDSALTSTQAGKGWPFKVVVDSSEFNEMMYRVTTLLNDMEKNGILDWSELTDYPVGGLTRGATNGLLYECITANGPNVGGTHEPETSPTYWKPATFGAGSTVRFITGNITAVQNEVVYCTAGSLTVTLPTNVTEGGFVRVVAGTGITDVNKITVAGTAIDVAGTLTTEIGTANSFIDFYWDGVSNIWRTAKGGAGGGGTSGVSRSIFEVFYSMSSETPPGALSLATGMQILNCDTVYPDFWAKCVSEKAAGTIRVLTEAAWQAEALVNGDGVDGDVGAFVVDEGAKTVRLPRISSSYLRAGTVSTLGTYLGDAIRNITGLFSGACGNNAGTDDYRTGAFYTQAGNYYGFSQSDQDNALTGFDASRAPGVKVADENRPKTIYGCLYIQVYNAAIPASVAQANQFVNMIENRAQTDLSNISAIGAAKIGNVLSLGTVATAIDADTIYTATEDGLVSVKGTSTTTSYILIEVTKGLVNRSSSTFYNSANKVIALSVPVYAGEQYKVTITNVTSPSIQFVKNNGAA